MHPDKGDARDIGLLPGMTPWRRKWQPTPIFLPGKFHGQRSLVGYSPRGHKDSDMAEQVSKFQLLADQVDPFGTSFLCFIW